MKINAKPADIWLAPTPKFLTTVGYSSTVYIGNIMFVDPIANFPTIKHSIITHSCSNAIENNSLATQARPHIIILLTIGIRLPPFKRMGTLTAMAGISTIARIIDVMWRFPMLKFPMFNNSP